MKRKNIVIGKQYVVRMGNLRVPVDVVAQEQSGFREYVWTCHEIYPEPRNDGTYMRTPAYAMSVYSSQIDCTLETHKRREAHRQRLVASRQRKLDKLAAKARELEGVLQALVRAGMGDSVAWLQCKAGPFGDITVTLTPHAASCLMHTVAELKECERAYFESLP